MLNQDSSVSLEYAISVLAWLESFTGKRLNDQETKLWVARLQKYPRRKLLELDSYTGGLNNNVFKFLDEVQTVREDLGYKKLPEPEQTPRSIQIARDFNEHVQKVLSFQGTREERLLWEKNSFLELDKKYPHLAVWEKVKHEKRFSDAKT